MNQTIGEWIQSKHILVRPFECKVEEKATLSTQNCQFPFILNGKTFNNCTDHSEPNGRLWCPTQVSDSGEYLSKSEDGYWGHCNIIDGDCRDTRRTTKNDVLKFIVETSALQGQIAREKQDSSSSTLLLVLGQSTDEDITRLVAITRLQQEEIRLKKHNDNNNLLLWALEKLSPELNGTGFDNPQKPVNGAGFDPLGK